MARNYVSASEDAREQGIGQVSRQMSWLGLVYWGASILLAGLVWVRVRYVAVDYPALASVDVLPTLALAALHGLLTITLARSLAFTPLRIEWRYRLAFLTSAGLTIVHWLLLLVLTPDLVDFPLFAVETIVACAGAFLGGLFATGIDLGLWEDNSPPAESVQEEVLQRHQELISSFPPVPALKRGFDVLLALTGLVLSSPVWIVSTIIIWMEDPGPILFVKNSVAKGGGNFHQFKFRTMVRNAETRTGPVLSQMGDQRILAYGRFLRKTALDELPQLINILHGEMSFVGPRPQRTVLVHGYLEDMPEYAERHRVLPGLAGLAQVAGDYYLTPRQKLRFDRLYIPYVSLGFDLKLLFLAFLITFWFRWQQDWKGRLPRWMIRWGNGRAKHPAAR